MTYSEDEVLQYISENDVKFIKLFFTDIFGNVKSISIQPSEMRRAFSEGIPFDASELAGFLYESENNLFIVPDPSTLCVLPWRPQKGRVVRFFCSIKNFDGTDFEGDTRTILKNTVKNIQKNGFELKIGGKCKFSLFKCDEKGSPTEIPYDYASSCDLAPSDKCENIRRDICLTLEKMGIFPESSRHQASPGQNQVDFKCDSLPTSAADNFQTFKTVAKTISNQNGLFASFSPRHEFTNNFCVKIALFNDSKNLFSQENLSSKAKNFISGILNRTDEISHFLSTYFFRTNPENLSRLFEWERITDQSASTNHVSISNYEILVLGWTRKNLKSLIRTPLCKNDLAAAEFFALDLECNIYLALALILQAGFEGVQNEINFDADQKNVKINLGFKEQREIAQKSDFVKSLIPEKVLKAFVENQKWKAF